MWLPYDVKLQRCECAVTRAVWGTIKCRDL
ncbi:hypothetical protein DN36_2788 [Vibrio cholerae]|nr:hypothetical protein DN36_2788 [Vibrio cholerae]